jgi:peptide-methionine (S)-S-oxide reductase
MTKNEEIVFGTGCFWCTEAIFKRLEGVVETIVGYAGGTIINPNYETVCSGKTGHAEVTKIVFDPNVITLEKLLDVFWKVHDPTSLNRQGNDVGTQYRSIILYTNEDQRLAAERSKEKINGAVTEIIKLEKFYPAEDYHADYFAKNGSQPYCQMVIRPKVEKIFGDERMSN